MYRRGKKGRKEEREKAKPLDIEQKSTLHTRSNIPLLV